MYRKYRSTVIMFLWGSHDEKSKIGKKQSTSTFCSSMSQFFYTKKVCVQNSFLLLYWLLMLFFILQKYYNIFWILFLSSFFTTFYCSSLFTPLSPKLRKQVQFSRPNFDLPHSPNWFVILSDNFLDWIARIWWKKL